MTPEDEVYAEVQIPERLLRALLAWRPPPRWSPDAAPGVLVEDLLREDGPYEEP